MKKGCIAFFVLVLVMISWSTSLSAQNSQSTERIIFTVDGKAYTKADITKLESLHKKIEEMSGKFPKNSFGIKKQNIANPTIEYIRKLESVKKMIGIYSAYETQAAGNHALKPMSPVTEQTVSKAQYDRVNTKFVALNQNISDLNTQINNLKNENNTLIKENTKQAKIHYAYEDKKFQLSMLIMCLIVFVFILIIYVFHLREEVKIFKNRYEQMQIHLEPEKIFFKKDPHSTDHIDITIYTDENSRLQKELKELTLTKDKFAEQETIINLLQSELNESKSKTVEHIKEKAILKYENDKYIQKIMEKDDRIIKLQDDIAVMKQFETKEEDNKKVIPLPIEKLEKNKLN